MKMQNSLSYTGTNKSLRELSYGLLNQDTGLSPSLHHRLPGLQQTTYTGSDCQGQL